MITPHQLDIWSSNMAELYNSLEGELIRLLIKRLKSGRHEDVTQWQTRKLQELRLFNSDVTKELAKVTEIAEPEIRRMFEEAGKGIVTDIDKAMVQPVKPLPTNLDRVMRAYSNQVWSDIDNYVNQTLVTTNYGRGSAQVAYQQVLNQTVANFNTGLHTFEQAVEKSVQDLAQKGIRTILTDRGGHSWSLENYTRTVLKSTLGNTYDDLRKDRMSEYDVHTVVVTSHVGARDKCIRIQGQVVDLRFPEELPPDWPYRSIYDPYWQADYKTAGGHRSVNCRHLHIVFIPGVNVNNQPEIDPKENARVARITDTQRRIEREIVKYKKNAMVAEEMGSDTASHWKQMVRKRQTAMRDHISENDDYLSRNYKREKVYTPLDALVKDFKYNQ